MPEQNEGCDDEMVNLKELAEVRIIKDIILMGDWKLSQTIHVWCIYHYLSTFTIKICQM